MNCHCGHDPQQHLLVIRRLRVMPAMTGALQTRFLEVTLKQNLFIFFPFRYYVSTFAELKI